MGSSSHSCLCLGAGFVFRAALLHSLCIWSFVIALGVLLISLSTAQVGSVCRHAFTTCADLYLASGVSKAGTPAVRTLLGVYLQTWAAGIHAGCLKCVQLHHQPHTSPGGHLWCLLQHFFCGSVQAGLARAYLRHLVALL